MNLHFLLVSQIPLMNDNPEKHHNPCGKLNTNIYIQIVSVFTRIRWLIKFEGVENNWNNAISLIFLKKA
jgi:hypothetical protein